ncbi:IclR family transcriptional regulator [Nocardioides hwasunensis]|uniref:IclR family transcriptional regulator n=1 Tax=Nocardioides hwasunensis TaxID=397258 RepID=A0ABR8MIY3_9ACTN|nr:IclR family transcriptional regulator [Nocardioides hwasunensis]MBD3915873.1 IclR family transcriptional regulator [Nocardioides hwasunensis]
MSDSPARPGSPRVQSVERAAALLRAVALATGQDGTATALAEAVGLNRTTTWRILTTLEEQRLVSRDDRSGVYSLGFGFLDLAGQAGGVALARMARVVLHELSQRAGETAALAVVRNGVLTYVAEVTADAVVAAGWRDREVSMHATSTGKVLLAYSDAEDVRVLLRQPRGTRLPRHTSTTITTYAALEKELALTRERGFAVCRGEFESSAWGVSAPVLDVTGRPVAVVSLWGPSERLTDDRFEPLGALAMSAAAEIAGRRTSSQRASRPGSPATGTTIAPPPRKKEDLSVE